MPSKNITPDETAQKPGQVLRPGRPAQAVGRSSGVQGFLLQCFGTNIGRGAQKAGGRIQKFSVCSYSSQCHFPGRQVAKASLVKMLFKVDHTCTAARAVHSSLGVDLYDPRVAKA